MSRSPYRRIPDEHGSFGGIWCLLTEATQRIIGERQMSLLRELAAKTADARTRQEACKMGDAALETDPND